MTDEDFRRQFGLTAADMADLNQLVSLMPDEPGSEPARRRRVSGPFTRLILVLGIALAVVAVLLAFAVALPTSQPVSPAPPTAASPH